MSRTKLDRGMMITHSNFMEPAIQYHTKNQLSTKSLKETLEHIIKHSSWKLGRRMQKDGINEFYELVFRKRLGFLDDGVDMNWWDPEKAKTRKMFKLHVK
jgi:hypothetical protein